MMCSLTWPCLNRDESNEVMQFARREGGVPFREVLYKSLGKSQVAKQGLIQETWKFLIVMNQLLEVMISR
ncbi:hypothetical protein CJO66_26050 [Burkholderia ubonensis]|nr:hypothetical protein CJO71_13615 [Burkholderia ubonensis]PAJ85797.1 hypothetical protein CJO70_21210 [Burkholderia ubonensis]PAK00679.1 hypothetical protein CJO68_13345 [Burkholderia ubonensis]PAK11892.1 hypothetical protein CJO66_26050 [Burkholderia ubonensis]